MTMRAGDGSGTSTASGDDTGPAPSGGTTPPGPALDAALGQLSTLADMPVDDHVAVFNAIHEALRDSLADPRTGSDGQAL